MDDTRRASKNGARVGAADDGALHQLQMQVIREIDLIGEIDRELDGADEALHQLEMGIEKLRGESAVGPATAGKKPQPIPELNTKDAESFLQLPLTTQYEGVNAQLLDRRNQIERVATRIRDLAMRL